MFIAFLGHSQVKKTYVIEGVLVSKSDTTSLESATVHLEKVKDSAVVSYTITDRNGKFKLEGNTFDKELRLVVSFLGYKPYTKVINFDQTKIQLGTIALEDSGNVLNEVVITSRALM